MKRYARSRPDDTINRHYVFTEQPREWVGKDTLFSVADVEVGTDIKHVLLA